ncbi:MAG: hypothetical protein FWE08_02250 [Oscillospiraceae bacterium]|nr:hypothetical protein [Oscillospiraceae bacterium]
MGSILENLFYQHDFTQETDRAALQRIATNTGMLKKDFNKWQKKRLLHIIDDKNLLAAQRANNSFVSGVRYGVMFMVEVFNGNSDDIDS